MGKKSISAVVLAGGNSSRMGRNKALLKLGEKTMIEIILDILRGFFDELVVVTKDPEAYPMLQNVKFVPDAMKFQEKNSLIGLYSGLEASKNPFAFVVPCDMPLIHPKILQYMLEQHKEEDVLIPFMEGHYQPLHAIYGKNCLRAIEGLLNKRDYKIINFFQDIVVKKIEDEEIKKFDPYLKSFLNINTYEEYQYVKINYFNDKL